MHIYVFYSVDTKEEGQVVTNGIFQLKVGFQNSELWSRCIDGDISAPLSSTPVEAG